jgi:hypothetical protein
MELALPHVVVWTTGPGLGTDLVAALAAHPVEVSEIRGMVEAERAATSRPPLLVLLVSPQDAPGRIAAAAMIFPGVPILLYTIRRRRRKSGRHSSTPSSRSLDSRASTGRERSST